MRNTDLQILLECSLYFSWILHQILHCIINKMLAFLHSFRDAMPNHNFLNFVAKMFPIVKLIYCRITIMDKGKVFSFHPFASPSFWVLGGHYIICIHSIHYSIYKALDIYTPHWCCVPETVQLNLSVKTLLHFIPPCIAWYCALFYFMGSLCNSWNGANTFSDSLFFLCGNFLLLNITLSLRYWLLPSCWCNVPCGSHLRQYSTLYGYSRVWMSYWNHTTHIWCT